MKNSSYAAQGNIFAYTLGVVMPFSQCDMELDEVVL